ncbi:hsp70-binding protein 1 [Latimeria chalumnae]|uniref:Hsp70-binding protein 1 n=1 Tax=Latimeria chalumnae TaxID=7897 RepID=H3A3J2_LATCH|nr:PREDICTED: hsp70-binding protein 1 [Latimeria chalumnae]XP_006012970.1 PREDICTED: hsp70-binding protein 1 [Latimeria chalumnae]XP_006012971.1 PREDICTED: hsp70-binding protein 1 [Latimeria chalumnae]|eukprot:XP_006012969.1 PREDICTED: hsp70-binding protein 1 [Latimeria chalumnae]
MAEGGPDRNRQHPQNLQGLLRLAVEVGVESQETSHPEPMSEERRNWLQEAMADAFQGHLDEIQQIKQSLEVLRQEERVEDDEENEERKAYVLDLLADLCENLDNASDFCKLEGMQLVVERYLQHPVPELRWRTAHLIGTCSQNNPFVQEHVLHQGTTVKLLELLDKDSSDPVRIKALFAISCLIREQEAGLREFLNQDGFSVLMRAMQSDVDKLKVKAAFLLQNLLISHPEHRDVLCSMGMVQQLVSLLQSEHSAFHEYVLGALCSFVTDFPRGMKECRELQLGLEEVLRERIVLLKGQESFQEELEFCEQLLKSCFSGQQEDNGMDR